jgi:hypothetical protein
LAARLDNKIASLARWACMRKRRAAVVAVLGFILLAQSALVVHQIQHHAVAHDTSCVLCLAAGHLAGGAATVQLHVPAFTLIERLALPASVAGLARSPLAYLSRGPPSSQS